ncbi:hypothetical protein [Futiania mangrovi]|uniref:Cell division and transport-associated protein TolA n=1 Tax=Futiania mangrovi TaxID=2959716 RepID=A0A9J6P8J6_9PROT|nr:hypothetical protein [Futiania mangrovii]MCP1334893.1 hypothetical protein [Futiania mangrovii]
MRRSIALSLGLHAAVATAAVVTWPHAARTPMVDAGAIGVEVVLPGAAELQGPAQMEEVTAPAAEATADPIADAIASLPPEQAVQPDTPPAPPPPPQTPAAEAPPPQEPAPDPDAATLVPALTEAPPVKAAEPAPEQVPPPPPRPAETVQAAEPVPETAKAEPVEAPDPAPEPVKEPVKEPETAKAEPVPAEPQKAETVEPEPKAEPKTEIAAAPVPKRKPTPPPAPKQERAEAPKPKTPAPTATSFLDRVAAAVDNARTAPPAAARSAGQARAGIGSGLTDTERDRLRRQVSRCWREPVGAPRPEELVVTLSVELTRDGKVSGRPRAIEVRRDDSHYRAAIDAAVRAVLRCQPYDMPADKYDSWRTVELVFDPADPSFR